MSVFLPWLKMIRRAYYCFNNVLLISILWLIFSVMLAINTQMLFNMIYHVKLVASWRNVVVIVSSLLLSPLVKLWDLLLCERYQKFHQPLCLWQICLDWSLLHPQDHQQQMQLWVCLYKARRFFRHPVLLPTITTRSVLLCFWLWKFFTQW